MNYTINNSNISLLCTGTTSGNDTFTQCVGTIQTIPYNQDIIVALLTIITSCIVLILFAMIFKLLLKR